MSITHELESDMKLFMIINYSRIETGELSGTPRVPSRCVRLHFLPVSVYYKLNLTIDHVYKCSLCDDMQTELSLSRDRGLPFVLRYWKTLCRQ